ncbi:hypothetical protein AAT19DRAFT_14142 [Rhodotorula toruloides]|uniref:RING-type domain-containing protein n=1 Tax=Rhodotorula toruloides TaxID=5286 RepID=A0A2T0AAT2_RHOTO|nr:hypothetical protein AAT19DRAFT_14142 [Rhodotorula toruloides]
MSTIDSCGICLDTFHLSDTAVALPCKHLYHEDCLVPWLKTSGTCPTCRFALVPQPGQPGYEAGGQANAEGAQAGEGGTDGAEDQRIPEIAGGSSLPGSWIWPAGEGEGEEGGSEEERRAGENEG